MDQSRRIANGQEGRFRHVGTCSDVQQEGGGLSLSHQERMFVDIQGEEWRGRRRAGDSLFKGSLA